MDFSQEFSTDVIVPEETTEDEVKRLLDTVHDETGNGSIFATLVKSDGMKSVEIKFRVGSSIGHINVINAIRGSFGKLMDSEQEKEAAGACT